MDNNKRAIEVLEAELASLKETCKRDCANIEQAISRLRRADAPVRKNGWKGMTLPDAIQAYLSACDGPVAFSELLQALKVGGVELGQDAKRYERNLRSTLGNTRNRFKYNKEKDTVEAR